MVNVETSSGIALQDHAVEHNDELTSTRIKYLINNRVQSVDIKIGRPRITVSQRISCRVRPGGIMRSERSFMHVRVRRHGDMSYGGRKSLIQVAYGTIHSSNL